MKELSLHILDIVQNSIAAEASKIEIIIKEDIQDNLLKIIINDNGCGMGESEKEKVLDPFVTSRSTREVGLGLPFLKKAAEICNGSLSIKSKKGKGTKIEVEFEHDHIDRAPIGDIVGTISTLITVNPELDFLYKHIYNEKEFQLDTEEIKKEIEDVKINHPEIINWIEDYLNENLAHLRQ